MNIDLLRISLQQLYGQEWELAIFQFYSGQVITPTKNIKSPVRDNDNSASLRIFKNSNQGFLAYDYGRNKTYNWLTFVHAYYENLNKSTIPFNIESICEIVNNDMGLGISDDIFNISVPNTALILSDREFKKTEPPDIAVYPNKWGGVDTRYWGNYYITEEWLKFFSCGVAYKSLFSYDKGLTWKHYHTYKQSDPSYYYYFIDSFNNPKFKILRPFALPFNDIEYKWRTNIDKTDLCSIQGFRQAIPSDIALLTSSLKDVIVWRMIGVIAYAQHGEAYLPVKDFIDYLKQTHKEVWLNMNSDVAGIEASAKIKPLDSIFTREIFTPLNIAKDPSDFVKNTKGDFKSLQNLLL